MRKRRPEEWQQGSQQCVSIRLGCQGGWTHKGVGSTDPVTCVTGAGGGNSGGWCGRMTNMKVSQLATELADAKPMCRGSLSKRMIKCGKPSCACAQDPKARHGPHYSLTHVAGGKTGSRYFTGEQVALVREQISAGRKFRRQVEALFKASEQWANSELAGASASPEEAQKGGSRQVSKTRSPRKSIPS
jgi:hypothetical protein